GYGFNKCISGDTLIEMAHGSRKRITDIRDGDVVLTKDGPFLARGVRPSGVRDVGTLRLANGMTVRCTPDHPIFTQRGWLNAQDLTAADTVAVLAKRWSDDADVAVDWTVLDSFVLDGREPTYDFEVPGAHSFIANGIAVHNSHAAAYALVAYQTGYFKANYPV